VREGEKMNYVSNDFLMLSKYPEFDNTWSDEIKIKWIDGFRKLILLCVKESPRKA